MSISRFLAAGGPRECSSDLQDPKRCRHLPELKAAAEALWSDLQARSEEMSMLLRAARARPAVSVGPSSSIQRDVDRRAALLRQWSDLQARSEEMSTSMGRRQGRKTPLSVGPSSSIRRDVDKDRAGRSCSPRMCRTFKAQSEEMSTGRNTEPPHPVGPSSSIRRDVDVLEDEAPPGPLDCRTFKLDPKRCRRNVFETVTRIGRSSDLQARSEEMSTRSTVRLWWSACIVGPSSSIQRDVDVAAGRAPSRVGSSSSIRRDVDAHSSAVGPSSSIRRDVDRALLTGGYADGRRSDLQARSEEMSTASSPASVA